jgi:hypothetical protein
MHKYRATSAVIDANPERRKAFEFSQRFYGHVKMCFYGVGVQGKQIHESKSMDPNNPEPIITVNRTSWLDLSLGRYRNQTIEIPSNTPHEYEQHLKALIRMYEKDKDGNPYGKYVKNSEDHYAHARNYAEIALPFAAYLMNPQSMKSPNMRTNKVKNIKFKQNIRNFVKKHTKTGRYIENQIDGNKRRK